MGWSTQLMASVISYNFLCYLTLLTSLNWSQGALYLKTSTMSYIALQLAPVWQAMHTGKWYLGFRSWMLWPLCFKLLTLYFGECQKRNLEHWRWARTPNTSRRTGTGTVSGKWKFCKNVTMSKMLGSDSANLVLFPIIHHFWVDCFFNNWQI